MGKLTVTIKATTVNIRRGPSNGAGIAGKATVGQQFEVVQLLDTPDSKEQWARIEHPEIDQAYVCTRMASGQVLAQVGMAQEQVSDEFKRGYNACLDDLHRVLVPLWK